MRIDTPCYRKSLKTKSLASPFCFALDYYNCVFHPDPEDWQFQYHAAYRLILERTTANTPTGHAQVQPISGSWAYQGGVRVLVNGSAVNLYSDFNLSSLAGKKFTYVQGDGKIDNWFQTGFVEDTEIQVEHSEDPYPDWYINAAFNTGASSRVENAISFPIGSIRRSRDRF